MKDMIGRGSARKIGGAGGGIKIVLAAALLFLFVLPVLAEECVGIEPARSVPSNGFRYGWDRFWEKADMFVTNFRGDEAKINKHMDFADRRLAEACLEESIGNDNNVNSLIEEYNGEIEQINDLSPRVSARTNSEIRNRLQQRTSVLTTLLSKVPEEGQQGIQNALDKMKITKKTVERNRVARIEQAEGELSESANNVLGKTVVIDRIIPANFLPESEVVVVCVFGNENEVSRYSLDYSKDDRTIVATEATADVSCDIKTDVEMALNAISVMEDGNISFIEARNFNNLITSTEE